MNTIKAPILIALLLFLNSLTQKVSAEILGLPSSVTISSHRIFDERVDGEQLERVTEVCFQMTSQMQWFRHLNLGNLLGRFSKNNMSQAIVPLIKTDKDDLVLLRQELDEFIIDIELQPRLSSLEDRSVKYFSSVFERNFNQERKNGQVNYKTERTGNALAPITTDFCEVYFFNNLSTPDQLIDFLLGFEQVALLDGNLQLDYTIKLKKSVDMRTVVAISDQLNLAIALPVLGLNITDETRTFFSESLNNDIANAIEDAIADQMNRLTRQTLLSETWFDWYEDEAGSRAQVVNVQAVDGCSTSTSGVQSGISLSELSEYFARHQPDTCQQYKASVLSSNIECKSHGIIETCDITLPQGTYITSNDGQYHSIGYVADATATRQFKINNTRQNIRIALPYACRQPLLGNQSSSIHPLNTSVSPTMDLRQFSVEAMNQLVLSHSLSQPSQCEYRDGSGNLRMVDCQTFSNGKVLCSKESRKDIWQMLYHSNEMITFHYIDKTITSQWRCDETQNTTCGSKINVSTATICTDPSVFRNNIAFDDGQCNIGLYRKDATQAWLFEDFKVSTITQAKAQAICFTPSWSIINGPQRNAALKVNCKSN